MSILSIRIKQERQKRAWTQVELANRLNLSKQTINNWESGRRTPNPTTVVAISELFNVSTDYLLGKTNDSSLTQEHLENTYKKINENLGEDVQVMFHDITTFDEEELDKLKFAIEMIKRDKKKKTP